MTDGMDIFQKLRLAPGCSLKKKETFEYGTEDNTYDIELFTNHDGTYYAIGLPREGGKLIVYGSSILPSAEFALQSVIDKISKKGMFGNETAEDADETFDEDEDQEIEE